MAAKGEPMTTELSDPQAEVLANLREHHGDTIRTTLSRGAPNVRTATMAYDVDSYSVEIVVTPKGRLRIRAVRAKKG